MEKRRTFLNSEKIEVLEKSNYICVHCGTKLSLYGDEVTEKLSVDHFIPLSLSGENAMWNLFPLCSCCNSEKSDYIISPFDYYRYLDNDKLVELKKISLQRESVRARAIFNKKNFMVTNQHTIRILTQQARIGLQSLTKKNKGKALSQIAMDRFYTKFYMKRAGYDNLDDIYTFVLYELSKLDNVQPKETIKEALINYYSKGAIYYITSSNGKILMVLPIVFETTLKSENYGILSSPTLSDPIITTDESYSKDMIGDVFLYAFNHIVDGIIEAFELKYLKITLGYLDLNTVSNYYVNKYLLINKQAVPSKTKLKDGEYYTHSMLGRRRGDKSINVTPEIEKEIAYFIIDDTSTISPVLYGELSF